MSEVYHCHRKLAMKERYHYLMFADPAGVADPKRYARDLLEPMGCHRIPIVFGHFIHKMDVDEIDVDKFTRVLAEGNDNGEIPQDSRVVLDVERPSLVPCIHLPEQSLWYQINQFGIDFWLRILEIAKAARPDCTFGFWGQLPNTTYAGVLATEGGIPQNRREIAVACWPLAEQCDFLVPALYCHRTWWKYNTLDDCFRWVRKSLEEAKRFYPTKPVLPMFMVEYLDLCMDRPNPDTAESQAARLLTGYQWAEFHRIADELADGTMYWGGEKWGENPFPFDSEWWHVTRQILGN